MRKGILVAKAKSLVANVPDTGAILSPDSTLMLPILSFIVFFFVLSAILVLLRSVHHLIVSVTSLLLIHSSFKVFFF